MIERLLQQIELAQQRDDILGCMRLCQHGLEAITRDHSPYAWAVLHSRLAQCYLSQSGSRVPEDLEASIGHFQLALQHFARQAHAMEWAACHDFLGLAFWLRRRGERSANIEAAIAHYQKALQVWTRAREPQIWAGIQDGLAEAFKDRLRGNHVDNLQQAIRHYTVALEVWTREENPPRWAGVHVDLADLYCEMRQEMAGQPLETAIHHYRLALQVITRERAPVQWARIQHGLGECYGERIEGGLDQNLEQSIVHYEQELLVYGRETHPEEWASTVNNLGVSYQHRVSGSRADNLQRAIHYFRLALQVYTRKKHPVAWSQTQNNLANAYLGNTGLQQARYTEQAIDHLRAALEVIDVSSEPVLWATIQFNLGNSFCQRRWWDMSRYLQQENGLALKAEQRDSDIETTIQHYHNALQVFKREQMAYDWAMVQNSLGPAYVERVHGSRAENIEQAIYHLNQALEVRNRQRSPELWAATQHNLGVAYEVRVLGNRKENKRVAERCYHRALQIFEPDRFPFRARKSLQNLAGLYLAWGEWEAALEMYECAVAALDKPLAMLQSERSRAFDIEMTADLYSHKAYCQLKLGQPAEAFAALEQGKARLLHDALQSREDEQRALAESRLPADVVKTIRQSLQVPGSDPTVSLADSRLEHHSASYYYQTFDDGAELDDFVINTSEPKEEEPTLPEEPTRVPEEHALIVPLVTTCGGAAFVVTGELNDLDMGHVIWMDKLTEQALVSLLAKWMRAYLALQQAGSESEREQGQEEWLATISDVTGELWHLLFAPVHERLKRGGIRRLIFLPQSRLQLLPLHAAWRLEDGQRRYLLDDYEISYAPSAKMHVLCQKRLEAPLPSGSLVVGVDSYQKLTPLSHAVAEARAVADILETVPLVDDVALKEAVLRNITGKGYLHFACHGRYGWQGQPLASALYLAGDEVLTLDELISTRNLQATRLVTMSACESGIAALTESPDEYVGLVAGFFLLGAAGIMSSLWSVDDRSTYLLMERFYRNHLTEKLPPAQALREAQLWLRDVTRRELGDYFKSLIDMRPSKAAENYMTMILGGSPQEKPYAHPFYWAAFTFTGA
ncbi:MAG: CHAT domain-containing protein [Candidatus Thiodiazotropha sp. (ex Dulcina madagascariensis)]|nr:CHAT domain-containing protein [Candidatus Thiodiazotropha sp. (ex Dulcina madagascariensis)]